MQTIENLCHSNDLYNLKYHYKSPTANLNFNNFIDAATLNEIKFKRIKLADVEKNQMKFKSKLSNIRIGGEK